MVLLDTGGFVAFFVRRTQLTVPAAMLLEMCVAAPANLLERHAFAAQMHADTSRLAGCTGPGRRPGQTRGASWFGNHFIALNPAPGESAPGEAPRVPIGCE